MLLSRVSFAFGLSVLALSLAGCQTTTAPIVTGPAVAQAPVAPPPIDPSTLDPNNPIEDQSASIGFGEPELPLLGGYRNVNDPCQLAGESRFTSRHKSPSADLVACLRGGGSERIIAAAPGVRAVAQTESYTVFSVPRGAVARAVAG